MKHVILIIAVVMCGAAIMSVRIDSYAGTDTTAPAKDQEPKAVDVRVEEIVLPEGAAWKDFQGVLKCVIVDPKASGLTKSQQLNVVAVNPEAGKKGMFVHKGSEISLEKNGTYTMSVEDRLPKGWESIKNEFADERIGLCALVEVKKLN
jgi:hypothetical protein